MKLHEEEQNTEPNSKEFYDFHQILYNFRMYEKAIGDLLTKPRQLDTVVQSIIQSSITINNDQIKFPFIHSNFTPHMIQSLVNSHEKLFIWAQSNILDDKNQLNSIQFTYDFLRTTQKNNPGHQIYSTNLDSLKDALRQDSVVELNYTKKLILLGIQMSILQQFAIQNDLRNQQIQ